MIAGFNLAMVALQVGAAFAYIGDNPWKAVYWTACAVLTMAVWNM